MITADQMVLVHIERWESEDWPGHGVMMCGAVVLFDENGDVTPAGFDFVHRNWPENATCAACKILTPAPRARARARKLVDT